MSAQILAPSYSERILFLGSNGTGKTKLSRRLLAAGNYPRWIVLDVKGEFKPEGRDKYEIIRTPKELYAALFPFWPWENGWKKHPHIIYRPEVEFQSGPWLDWVMRTLYKRAVADFDQRREIPKYPFICIVDEALFMAKTGSVRWMSACAVTGRSLGIGLWITSQRPAWIPVEVRSEAWRWYVFHLAWEEDEKEVIKYSKRRLTLETLQEGYENWSFWELKRGSAAAGRIAITHYPPIKLQEAA
jgi:hypothetical protein